MAYFVVKCSFLQICLFFISLLRYVSGYVLCILFKIALTFFCSHNLLPLQTEICYVFYIAINIMLPESMGCPVIVPSGITINPIIIGP